MINKKITACLAACCLIIGGVMPVSAEEPAGSIVETVQEEAVEEKQEITVETDQNETDEDGQGTSTETDQDVPAEEGDESAELERDIYTEITDSVYVEGGNAEDSVAGIQPFAAQSFTGQYRFQLDGLALDMYEQMSDNYSSKRRSDPINFTPDASGYGLEFDAPAGDSETVAQEQEELREEISYAMSSALGAFLYDRPEVYWLHGLECGWTFSGVTSGGTTHWQVSQMTLTPTMYFDNAADDWPKFEEGVNNAVEELSAQIEASDTAYEKAKKIHDWINERLTYNYDAVNSGGDEYLYAHTAYPLFVEGKGNAVVCEGYAKAFKILCNKLGVGCVLVSGMSYTSSGSGAHMWNMVSMPDYKYYAVDLTWDDSGDAGYDTYFMVGANTKGFDKTFSQEHVMNTELVAGGMNFVLPVLAEEAYEPDEKYYGNGEWDEEQGTYTITYNPAQTAKVPEKVFEETISDDTANKITVNIPDLNLSIEGRYNFGNYEFEIPYDADVKEGIYDTSVILEQTSPGFEAQWKDTKTLKIKVEEDMQGFHYINSVVETDGNQDAVFRFKNGTGENRIVSIDGISLGAEGVDVGENKDDSVYMSTAWLEYDLDEGTVTIPARKIYDNRSDFAPYVYKVKLRFTLADGETVYESEPFGDDFNSVPNDQFQNPGDEAWYFMYREPEPDVLLGDINLDGEVNSGDLAYMLQVTNKRIDEADLSEIQLKAGDVSGADGGPDGVINSGDLAELLQYINGRIESLG